MNSHIENLLLESLPGNNLTPRDLKSTDRFTAEENTIRKREEKSENRLDILGGKQPKPRNFHKSAVSSPSQC